MTIGILTAMDKEYNQIAGLIEGVTTIEKTYRYAVGMIGSNRVVLTKSGIGKVNAAVGTSELIREFQPDAVISTGCAGGIDKSLKVMDVVVSRETVHHDFVLEMGYERGHIQGMPRYFEGDARLVSAAESLQDPSIHIGLICTGDQFISDHSQLQRIKAQFPEALAVDMESAAIAQTCYLHKVPFVSFRVLSDTPGADQHLEQYQNFWDEMADRSFEVTRRFLAALPEKFAILKFED